MTFRRIVVAVNGSPSSAQAVERAAQLARSNGSEPLTVLGVDEPPPRHAFRVDTTRRGRIEAIVDQAVAQARAAGVEARGEVRRGYPAEALVGFAERELTDLLVIGGGSPGRLRLGRTADKVVDMAHCAVLVVY